MLEFVSFGLVAGSLVSALAMLRMGYASGSLRVWR